MNLKHVPIVVNIGNSGKTSRCGGAESSRASSGIVSGTCIKNAELKERIAVLENGAVVFPQSGQPGVKDRTEIEKIVNGQNPSEEPIPVIDLEVTTSPGLVVREVRESRVGEKVVVVEKRQTEAWWTSDVGDKVLRLRDTPEEVERLVNLLNPEIVQRQAIDPDSTSPQSGSEGDRSSHREVENNGQESSECGKKTRKVASASVENRNFLDVNIAGVKYKALFDPGAMISIVGLRVAEQLKDRLIPTTSGVKCATGTVSKALGILKLSMEVDGYTALLPVKAEE